MESRVYSLVVVHRPLLGVSSLVEGAWVCGLQLFRPVGSVLAAYRLSCSAACGIFPDQGLNLCTLPWQVGSYPLDPREVLVS